MSDASSPVWELRSLREVVTKLVDGSHNPPPKQDTGLPMLSARNIDGGQVLFDDYRLISESAFATEHARTRIAPGDVLLTIVGTIGRTAVVPDGSRPFSLQRSVAVLTPSANLLPKFLCYQLESPAIQRHFEANARGTAQKGVYLKTLGQTPVVLPPVDVQREIVAELEKQFSRLDEAVANLQRVKANLKRYKASVLKAAVEGRLVETEASLARREGRTFETGEQLLQRILEERRAKWAGRGKYKDPDAVNQAELAGLPDGWTWVSVDSIAFVTKLAGFEYTKYVTYADDGDLAVLKAENAGPDGFRRTEYSRVHSDSVSTLTRSRVEAGDLLMVFVGAGTGNVACTPNDQQYFLGPNIAMIRVDPANVSSPYVEMFLRSPTGKNLALGLTKAVAQPSLSMGNIRMIPVALPPIGEQTRIVAEVDRHLSIIREVEAEVDANLQRAQALRQATLTKAFVHS